MNSKDCNNVLVVQVELLSKISKNIPVVMFHSILHPPKPIVVLFLRTHWETVHTVRLGLKLSMTVSRRFLTADASSMKRETDVSSKLSFQQQVILSATKKWIDSIVIAEKLCPFVAPLKQANAIRFVASKATTVEQAIYKFEVEAKLLLKGFEKRRKSKLSEETDGLIAHEPVPLHDKSSTHRATLIIFHGPFVTEFDDFDAMCELVNHNVLIEKKFFDILSVMNFHPNYISYYDVRHRKIDDSFYYPKRSPYPTMLLLPDVEMQSAYQTDKIQELCARNKMKFVEQGLKKCQSRLQSCYDVDPNKMN
jgi:uncharacterized protein